MYRALGLLILAAEGALAQSREPSGWDVKVPGYSNQAISWTPAGAAEVTCPCNSTGALSPTMDCRPAITATIKQTGPTTVRVTWESRPKVKLAYLTDQDGTIISYKDGGWDGSGRDMTFSWESSQQPTRLLPHIVYEDSCAVNNVDVFRTTVVRDDEREDVDEAASWRTKLALLYEKYDVGNSPTEDTAEEALKLKKEPCPQGDGTEDKPCVPKGTPQISASASSNDITLDSDWFNGGTAKAKFPEDGVGGADRNAAWLTNQDGTIIYYEEGTAGAEIRFELPERKPFPRGTVELHACRLFKTKKLCAAASIRDKYITKVQDTLTATSVNAYTSSNKPFTDLFTGYFDPGTKEEQDKGKPGMTSIGPKSGSSCTKKNATGHPLTDDDGKKLAMEYVIYAKELNDDGVEEPNAAVLGFAFDKALHFEGTKATKYKVYLACCTLRECSGSDLNTGLTLTTGTMDLNVFLGPTTFSVPENEKQMVPAEGASCHEDHDGHDHAEGAEEEEKGHPSDNTTWFKHEGRDCYCYRGTIMCKRADANQGFSMNEGETVGLVIAVSAIVFIIIGALFFFGYSAMLKRKQGDKGVVLQSDDDRL